MRIGLDVMGGDRGPAEVVAGALGAREFLGDDDCVVLVGDRTVIDKHLDEAESCSYIEVKHAEEAIGMGEPPVEALRTKPKSSFSLGRRFASMAAASTSTQVRTSYISCMSVGDSGSTRIPRRGITSTRPSSWRRINASRTGVRLMFNRCARSCSNA